MKRERIAGQDCSRRQVNARSELTHGRQHARSPEQQEIERLRREVQKLKAERDILKKAAAYFAKGIDMKFAFSAKHRGAGRRSGCAGRSVSRGAASMRG